jgi:hypothetical protein
MDNPDHFDPTSHFSDPFNLQQDFENPSVIPADIDPLN